MPHNFAFQINVDWFNPFKHTEGAIYISVLNLPRKLRYLQDNIVLVGVMPGPKELMNSYLKPLVEELKLLWSGVILKDHNKQSIIVRGAFICCCCDIPAGRKVVGHTALHGCSKCLLSFPTAAFGELIDYSNFDKTLNSTGTPS